MIKHKQIMAKLLVKWVRIHQFHKRGQSVLGLRIKWIMLMLMRVTNYNRRRKVKKVRRGVCMIGLSVLDSLFWLGRQNKLNNWSRLWNKRNQKNSRTHKSDNQNTSQNLPQNMKAITPNIKDPNLNNKKRSQNKASSHNHKQSPCSQTVYRAVICNRNCTRCQNR